MSSNVAQSPAETTVQELIQRFPLPIALLDEAGGPVVLNSRFEQMYGREVFGSPSLQALMHKPIRGWQTVHVPDREHGETDVKAQMLRVHDHPMLILNDAADPDLLREVSELHVQITELEKRSATDALTGAWNRAQFNRVISSELDRSIRSRQPISLVLLDIDHFKRINDTYGHPAGDSVLSELVGVIGGAIRSLDTLFRWGGEEFTILATSTGYRGARKLAETIRRAVEQHRFPGVGPVSISLGVAEHIATERADIWFKRVDDALYRAKHAGRNCVRVDEHGSSDMWAAENGPSVIRLIWQEAYECGEPTIDSEHRELFELANALIDASFNSKSAPEVFTSALDKLFAHIVRHFADEEAVLARYHYKGLEAHRRAHAALLARANELKASVAAGKATLGDFVEFLANVVVAQHLFKADHEFFPLFKENAA